ncbi:restriction endonuclease subunit S [Methanosarcina sp. DH2]|uniref:restriction endonuclease subunit S n=1 Tax=Methanosarcina sp. DH2 TaxID=2605639 RepID=UPI001E62D952|nr:restriction endonuclease subunit S [Methanosarcina sp. DH2]MCC4771483.1 restriction endonuclease subunit S [Methanosarcina sp. DH2]
MSDSIYEACLADVVEFIVDNRGRTAPTEEHGIPLIATNCVSNEHLYPLKERLRYVSQETYESWFRSHPIPGDILLTNKGSQNGAICLVPDPVDFCIAQDMVALRADHNKIYPLYLFAVLRSKLVQNRIKELNVDAVIPHFKKTDFNKLYFPLLGEKEQKFIGDLYFKLSHKIELNHQINQTLEEIAQTIFKSWFVNFDPVKAKISAIEAGEDAEGVIRAAMSTISGKTNEELDQLQAEQPEHYTQLKTTAELFPAAMQDSELGEIPEGWVVSNFGEVSACFDKNRIPLSKRQREQKKGSIPYYGATSIMDHVDKHIFDGIYLLLGEDGSVLKDDGSPFIQYIWGKSWVNNHAHVLQGTNGVSTEHLMLFMQDQNITAYVTGAVQLKLNQKNMNSIPFINAGKSINDAFYASIAPLYAYKRNAEEEIKSLSNTRDTLLPKLLSGEISVEAAEFAEE